MKAANRSPLALEAVAKHFEQWRERKKKGERIPEQLWREAIDLVDHYGVSQVTRTLRLSGTDLNKRRGIVGNGQRRHKPSSTSAFVEVEPTVVEQAMAPSADAAAWMELERPDGFRLRIRPTGGADLLALMDRFLGA